MLSVRRALRGVRRGHPGRLERGKGPTRVGPARVAMTFAIVRNRRFSGRNGNLRTAFSSKVSCCIELGVVTV